jgi:hypothetical protein
MPILTSILSDIEEMVLDASLVLGKWYSIIHVVYVNV